MIKTLMSMVLVLCATLARADVSQFSSFGNNQPYTTTIEPGLVTTGAAVDTGLMNLKQYKNLWCTFRNPDGATRSVIPICVNAAGSATEFTWPTISVTTGSTAYFGWDPDGALTLSTTIGGVTNLIHYPVRPCPYMKVQAAAASGPAEVLCLMRSH